MSDVRVYQGTGKHFGHVVVSRGDVVAALFPCDDIPQSLKDARSFADLIEHDKKEASKDDS